MTDRNAARARSGTLAGRAFSWRENGARAANGDVPLVVAVHGGGYSSAYFDVDGFSLLARAGALGIPTVAIDRAGYGETAHHDEGELSHRGQADLLAAAIGELWTREARGAGGIVLVGHSIGGAIALDLAGRRLDWPLLGVAVSGIGLANAPGDEAAWSALPPIPFIQFPEAMKDVKMFGPAGSFAADAPARTRPADAPAARRELIDIVTTWPREAAAILGRIAVPVHYRQAAEDALWTVGADEVACFAAACTSAPRVDAALVPGAGHSIDFHRIGFALQLEQLAFALTCAVAAPSAERRDHTAPPAV